MYIREISITVISLYGNDEGEIVWSAEPSLFLIVICGRFHLLVRIRFSKRFPEQTPLSNINNTVRNGSFHYD